MSDRTTSTTAAELELPLVLIDEPPHRLRGAIDPARLGDLADSIAAEGLHQAIGVCGPDATGRYTIGYGHRRFLATRLLRRDRIRARVYPDGTDLLLIASSENHNREQLNPMEEAREVKQYLDRGDAIAAIARLLRRSDQWVRERRDLLQLPADLQDALEAERITLAVARALGAVDHNAYRASLIDEAARAGSSARVVDVWVAHYHADRERLVTNHATIDQMVERREVFTIHAACESCGKDVDMRDTRVWRFCTSCSRDIAEAAATV